MGFWAIICFIITAVAIEEGDVLMIVIFGGLGMWFVYLWTIKDERKKKAIEKRKRKEEEWHKRRSKKTYDAWYD